MEQWAARYEAREAEIAQMDEPEQLAELEGIVRDIRFGPLSERLVWLIQQQVVRHRQSAVLIPDLLICDVVWGPDPVRHWRQALERMLTSMANLHLAEYRPGDEQLALGASTALLTHFRIPPRRDNSTCPDGCLLAGGPRHEHVLISIGRGFLGCLERLAEPGENNAIRQYRFPTPAADRGVYAADERLLRQIGRSGRLTTAFLPAKLGRRDYVESLSCSQHRLLQTIFRERTRTSTKRRTDATETEVFTGPMVPPVRPNRRGVRPRMIRCDLLEEETEYAGFNGNRKLKGRGYRLPT